MSAHGKCLWKICSSVHYQWPNAVYKRKMIKQGKTFPTLAENRSEAIDRAFYSNYTIDRQKEIFLEIG